MRHWWLNWGRFILLGLLLGLSCFHLIHSPNPQAVATAISLETSVNLYSIHQSDHRLETAAKLPSCFLLPKGQPQGIAPTAYSLQGQPQGIAPTAYSLQGQPQGDCPYSLLPTRATTGGLPLQPTPYKGNHRGIAPTATNQPDLPPLQAHPLPPSLATWEDPTNLGDYFAQVKPSPVGYLVWSRFPVKVFLKKTATPLEESANSRRWNDWTQAVLEAVNEWGEYLPLEVVTEEEIADIVILRSRPPLDATIDPKTGQFQIPRARTAQTRYQFYLDSQGNDSPILSHRFTIHLSPNQSPSHTLGTARHEIGHALGIWGHSETATDALYFSQVSHPPSISPRDINTLKKIYEQPTRLGWKVKQ